MHKIIEFVQCFRFFSSLCILGEELRDAGPGIDVELFGELQEVLHGDALVRHLLHGGELLLHREVDALDDEVVGGLLAGQRRPLLQERFAVVVLSQPAKLLEVRLVFPAKEEGKYYSRTANSFIF